MAVEILLNDEARAAISEGVKKLAGAVKVTLGPRGRNVAFDQKYDVPLVTNDGVTIAKQIELEEPFEHIGAESIKIAALKTNEVVGDGTTAAVVIAESLIDEGIKNIVSGANSVVLKRGMERACDAAVEAINKHAIPVKDKNSINQIATISGNNDEFIGNMIAEAFDNVGLNGVVTVEDSQQMNTMLKFSKGIHFDYGYLSDYFINNQNSKTCELDKPYILLFEETIKNFKDILNILNETAETGSSLLIIAQDVEGEALASLALNVSKGIIKAAAVKCPGYGDTRRRNMEALSLMLGGQIVNSTMGMKLENCGLEVCGRAERAVIEKEATLIQDPANSDNEEVAVMSRKIRKQLSETKEDYEIEKLQTSLSLLAGGIAVITVGGISEIEMFERKYRMEDAIHAAYAAIDEGIVPGGGKALLLAIPAVDELIETLDGDEKTGAKILRAALTAPVNQIALNAGVDGSIVIDKLLSSDDVKYGFDAMVLKYVDLFEAGIIDPIKVVKSSLVNAVSAASMLLTTEAGVVTLGEPEK